MFPFTTQLVPLTIANFDLPAAAGWVLLLLPPSYVGFTEDPTPGSSANDPLPGRGGGSHQRRALRPGSPRMDGGGRDGQRAMPGGRWTVRRFSFLMLALLAPVALWGAFCTHDVAPAATLLVPYIAIDMEGNAPDPSGAATLLRVTNTAPEATLVQLTVWSADGQAVIGLTEVLSGYDIWTVNFRDLLTGNWSAFDTSRAATAPPNVDLSPPVLVRKTFEWGPDGRSPFDYPPIPAPFNIPYPTVCRCPRRPP